jgi:hypothetical protein
MSKISIAGASTGSATFTIESPATSTNRTLTLPDNTGTIVTTGTTTGISASAISTGTLAAARLPAGTVLQVVSTIKTDTFSTASTALVDITGMSVSITPTSASSKILVSYFLGHVDANDVAIMGVALLRGSTKIGFGDAAGSRISTSTGQVTNANRGVPESFMFLDSPATTSSTTYKLQIFTHNGTLYVNRTSTDTDSAQYFRAASTITAMEIAA